jgi:hypothetical protein
MSVQYMKFLYWINDLAYFRKATKWEIIKYKFRGVWTYTPDPNNLIIYDDGGWFKTPYKNNEATSNYTY